MKRYNSLMRIMKENPYNGDYVKWEDVQELVKENERLKEQMCSIDINWNMDIDDITNEIKKIRKLKTQVRRLKRWYVK